MTEDALAREGQALFGGGARAVAAEDDAWSIVLMLVSGADAAARAERAAGWVREQLSRDDVRVIERSSGAALALGFYADPESARARRDLETVRSVRVGDRRPFGRAFFQAPPPPPVDLGRRPEINLVSARRRLGERALYSLQVSVFDGGDRKRSAEAEAVRLRGAGEDAFYFHGPRLSMVTVGVFGREAWDAERRQLSRDVRLLQSKYPDNMLGGLLDGEPASADGVRQPSMLIEIPDPPVRTR